MSQGNTSTQQILYREHPSPHKWIQMPTKPQLKKQKHSWKCVLRIFQPALIELMSIVPHRLLTRHAQQWSNTVVMNGQTRMSSIRNSSLTGQFEENWQCIITCYLEVVGSWFHNPCKRRHCKSSTRVIKGFRNVDSMLGHLSGGRQYLSKSTT